MTTTPTSVVAGLEPAADGLSLVQDLANSRVPGSDQRPDPLQDVELADGWLQEVLARWAQRTGQAKPTIRVVQRDLAALRSLRERVRTALASGAPIDGIQANLTVSVEQGHVSYGPKSSGAGAVAGLVAAELLLAARAGTLSRLKACRNDRCGAVFYDRSKNASRVWHDVTTCGNVANLRASRARRRAEPLSD